MTTENTHHGGYVIVLSILIAFLLTIMPLPDWARPFRPPWTSLVVLYWCVALPQRVGVGTAFFTGLFLDVLTGTVLGQQAATLSIIAYIANRASRRVVVFPIWQQAFFVFLLLAVENLINTWILGTTTHPRPDFHAWILPLIGALLWPWTFIVLRDFHHRIQVR